MRSADGQQNNQDAGQIAGKKELTLLALPGRRDRGIGLMAVLLGRRRSLSGVFLYRVGGLVFRMPSVAASTSSDRPAIVNSVRLKKRRA